MPLSRSLCREIFTLGLIIQCVPAFGNIMAIAAGTVIIKIFAVYQFEQLQHSTCLPLLLTLAH